MNDSNELTLREQVSCLREGSLTPKDILDHALSQIEKTESKIDAWQFIADKNDLEKQWSEYKLSSPALTAPGIPIGIKDTIDVAGMPAERGSTIYSGRVPSESATCVQQLSRCGLIPIGKTVTTELAYFEPGKTKNPHNPQHTPGGSSSGSAAAVATRMVPVALGSQTAASVIRPAAFCGVVGYVASRGLFSMRGVLPLALSFDALGIIAKTVDDIFHVSNILQSRNLSGSIAAIKPKTVLAIDGDDYGSVEDEMRYAFDKALDSFADAGIVVKRESIQGSSAWPQLHKDIMAYEAAMNFSHEFDTSQQQLGDAFQSLVVAGRAISMRNRFDLALVHSKAVKQFDALFDHCDAIVTPAATGAAPHGLTTTGDPAMSRPWQLVGSSQCSLPFAQSRNGMPLGIQIIGGRYGDNSLLSIAKWIQEAFSWQSPMPGFLKAKD